MAKPTYEDATLRVQGNRKELNELIGSLSLKRLIDAAREFPETAYRTAMFDEFGQPEAAIWVTTNKELMKIVDQVIVNFASTKVNWTTSIR